MTEDRLTPLQIQHLPATSGWRRRAKPLWRSISGTSGPSHAAGRAGDQQRVERGVEAHLVERGYAPASINAKLSALNSLLEFLGLGGCRVKFLRVQRRLFRDAAGN